MPLRASNLQQSDLKHIVFLGDKDYLKREVWVLVIVPFFRFRDNAIKCRYRAFSLIPKGIKWQRHGGHVGVPNNGR
jgi:hypothetical protein